MPVCARRNSHADIPGLTPATTCTASPTASVPIAYPQGKGPGLFGTQNLHSFISSLDWTHISITCYTIDIPTTEERNTAP